MPQLGLELELALAGLLFVGDVHHRDRDVERLTGVVMGDMGLRQRRADLAVRPHDTEFHAAAGMLLTVAAAEDVDHQRTVLGMDKTDKIIGARRIARLIDAEDAIGFIRPNDRTAPQVALDRADMRDLLRAIEPVLAVAQRLLYALERRDVDAQAGDAAAAGAALGDQHPASVGPLRFERPTELAARAHPLGEPFLLPPDRV